MKAPIRKNALQRYSKCRALDAGTAHCNIGCRLLLARATALRRMKATTEKYERQLVSATSVGH